MPEAKADSKGIRFLDITDFSPGIYSNSNTVGLPGVAPPGIFPAPPGAADADFTFSCMALRNGGLGPGPALAGAPGPNGLRLSDIGITTSGPVDISCLAQAFSTEFDELVIGITTVTGGTQDVHFYSYVVATDSLNSIYNQAGLSFAPGFKAYVAYPFTTVIEFFGPVTQPVMCLPLTAPLQPSDLVVYPDPANPNLFSHFRVALQSGLALGHQGRIVVTIQDEALGWPVTYSFYPNELFSYTDPTQSLTFPNQEEVFGPEAPFGYGALSSVSAGELFCVKRRGGALVIQGDLNNPTVTWLPSVQGTGNMSGRPDTDPNGIYYCSEWQGAWVWNGGNSSSKISGQLDDNFFELLDPPTDTSFYGYFCQRWNDWMLFSNNYVYDTVRGSWWKLSDNSVNSFFWYVPSYVPRYMFACTAVSESAGQHVLFEFDRNTPSPSYQWRSLPLKIPAEDRSSTVAEIVVRASNPYSDPHPAVHVLLVDDKNNPYLPGNAAGVWTMTPGIDTVQEIRMNAGSMKQSSTVAVQINASGTNHAPVIHSIHVGYVSREHIGQA